MTRKQQLCEMLTQIGLVFIRNRLSVSHLSWWRVMPWRRKSIMQDCFWVAQFLHNLPPHILEPEFTESDIWFLNQSQFFFKRAEPATSLLYQSFFSVFRQLFDLVPDAMKPGLEWDGPQLPEMTSKRQREVDSFLFHAVRHNNNIESLRNALVGGANLNARDEQGRTALELAREMGKAEHIRELQVALAKMGSGESR